MKRKSLGQIAFEAYNWHPEDKDTRTWEDEYQHGWEKAAKAVAQEVRKRSMQREGRG